MYVNYTHTQIIRLKNIFQRFNKIKYKKIQ